MAVHTHDPSTCEAGQECQFKVILGYLDPDSEEYKKEEELNGLRALIGRATKHCDVMESTSWAACTGSLLSAGERGRGWNALSTCKTQLFIQANRCPYTSKINIHQ